jgi:uncharacterized repeat protein (TIGR04076 family)
MDLQITVKRIEGFCPVYAVNDSFVLEDGYRLVSEKPLCMHSLAAILPFYNALRFASRTQKHAQVEERSHSKSRKCRKREKIS